ncbi:MAG: hypothetical protein NT149_01240 [Candidatus Gottesmanbacteria bacterium]|nr:hypothetical protein [Candidatus Gottesmanbacteria bacterium]
MRFPKKIPTIVGLLMVILIVGVIAIGSESYSHTVTTASGSIQPSNVQITNVSDTTFTVSWTTELPATGALSFDTSHGIQVIFDEQDTKDQGKYLTHSVTYRLAAPDMDYRITILSNGKKNLNGNVPYTVHTGSLLTTPSGNLEPAYGTIVSVSNQPVKGALVYITLEGGQTLSAVSKPSGTWLIPLNLVRTKDVTSYLPVTDRMTETIIVRSGGFVTNALTDSLNDSPVPNMTPGKTYDFRRLTAEVPGQNLVLIPTPQTQKSAAPAVLGTSSTKPANTVSLVIPAEGAALPTTLPLIQGTGIPGKTVSLVIGITNPIGDTTIVGANGVWSYTPKKPLLPGKQSVTITTKNLQNKPVAVTHMFEILKGGTQVLGDATPSATLTPTTTVTLTPTPTETPEATVSATPETTPESTLAAQPVPSSGNELPTIMLLILGIGLMIGGGIVLIKEKGIDSN